MILPIVAYGDPILKRVAEEIPEDYEGLKELIDNMYQTMYNANGVGLAGPQVGKSLRIFIVDASPFAEDDEEQKYQDLKDFKKVFINPIILEETGKKWDFEEGCLSIPGIREEVGRQEKLIIEYQDENFEFIEEEYDGIRARIIQHEYDHLEGVLFTDKIGSFRRRLIKSKLLDIAKGRVPAEYKMKFPS